MKEFVIFGKNPWQVLAVRRISTRDLFSLMCPNHVVPNRDLGEFLKYLPGNGGTDIVIEGDLLIFLRSTTLSGLFSVV